MQGENRSSEINIEATHIATELSTATTQRAVGGGGGAQLRKRDRTAVEILSHFHKRQKRGVVDTNTTQRSAATQWRNRRVNPSGAEIRRFSGQASGESSPPWHQEQREVHVIWYVGVPKHAYRTCRRDGTPASAFFVFLHKQRGVQQYHCRKG